MMINKRWQTQVQTKQEPFEAVSWWFEVNKLTLKAGLNIFPVLKEILNDSSYGKTGSLPIKSQGRRAGRHANWMPFNNQLDYPCLLQWSQLVFAFLSPLSFCMVGNSSTAFIPAMLKFWTDNWRSFTRSIAPVERVQHVSERLHDKTSLVCRETFEQNWKYFFQSRMSEMLNEACFIRRGQTSFCGIVSCRVIL